jgi:dihydrofolate reductase
MSKAQYYCAASLDGYIATADDSIDWLQKYEGSFEGDGVEPIAGAYQRFYDGVGALIMGSTTYAFVLGELAGGGEWPYQGKPTWILTSRELPTPEGDGVDVRMATARVRDLYDDLIAAAGERHLWIVGGGNVASQFVDESLLDEVIVLVVPVVLGDGKPLFDRGVPGAMRLTGARPFDNGMVELRYEVKRLRQ